MTAHKENMDDNNYMSEDIYGPKKKRSGKSKPDHNNDTNDEKFHHQHDQVINNEMKNYIVHYHYQENRENNHQPFVTHYYHQIWKMRNLPKTMTIFFHILNVMIMIVLTTVFPHFLTPNNIFNFSRN